MDTLHSSGSFEVEVISDVPYGEGLIGFGSLPEFRKLILDIYKPVELISDPLKPALIFSHGGSYHAGSKTKDWWEENGHHTTPVPDYCKFFAANGFVCFSVGYRLTQELVAPQKIPIRRNRLFNKTRIDSLRKRMNLPEATNEQLLNGIEGAISDVADAFKFVQTQAHQWGIDPNRIVLGGFSAGAIASIYATYALGVNAAAVISLSGGIDLDDADYYLCKGRKFPPILMFFGEFDHPHIIDQTMIMANKAELINIGMRRYFVPEKPHYYDCTSKVTLEQTNMLNIPDALQKTTLEKAINDFLKQTLALPEKYT